LTGEDLKRIYGRREARSWRDRVRRALEPPAPFVMNPREAIGAPLGRWNLCIGGGGRAMPGYINLDLFLLPGVDVAADAAALPFPADTFQRVECDAVLEHVRDPRVVMDEIRRVLAPGGYAHIVTPFCHPYHEYPRDFQRFSPDGLREVARGLEVIAEGWRTGPTATLLVFALEYGKRLLPWRAWRIGAHLVLGWLLSPLRYMDLLLFRVPYAGRIGNHCFIWLRKHSAE
jgi:SAM-dependent methyltransferase